GDPRGPRRKHAMRRRALKTRGAETAWALTMLLVASPVFGQAPPPPVLSVPPTESAPPAPSGDSSAAPAPSGMIPSGPPPPAAVGGGSVVGGGLVLPPRGGSPKKRYVGRRIDLDFRGADIHNILRLLADVGQVNIVTSDDVKGEVTIKMKNVPWDQALDVILRAKLLGQVREGNLI